MSDVEKAISGLVEDEELLHQQHHQQHQQQHQQQQHQQQSTPLHKTNINNYNLQNETGNSLLQKQPQQLQQQQQQQHQHQHQIHTHQQQDSNYLTVEQNNCLSRIVKLIFSTPGLVVMVVVYTIMGAFIFPLLEAPQDISKSAIIAKSREDCLKELWIITEKLNVLYERNWTMLVHEQLRRFEGTIVAATRNMAASAITSSTATSTSASSSSSSASSSGGASSGYGLATETTTTALGRFGGNNMVEYSDLTATRWSFSEALLYSVTVITTIGHGSLTPRTAGGKIATILYALIGVPLMLMCLSSLGALLAEALQCTYARLCCRWPQYAEENCEMDDEMMAAASQKPQPNKRPQRRLSRADVSVEKETHHEIKQRLHQCDFQDHHQHGINCKNCKYDAIIGTAATTTSNHGYDDDYQMCNDSNTNTNTKAATTIKHGHKEDCCQLLQNSPGKFTQHLSSCMQLKMSPTMVAATASTQQQQQQQQQQYYQQRPDVMLMTTGHKLSSSQQQQQQPTTMATACRMIIPTQRFYQNTTPAMATYHIVSSASANSSPTHHQQAIRHYIVPQQTGQTMGATQHFMAVPTNMVRFQTSATPPQTSAQSQQQQHHPQQQYGNTSSNININPLALPVSGSATVYFPIVTPAAATQQQQQHQQPNTSLTATMGQAAQQQPLVKYHTIQMPHKHRQQSLSLLNQPDLQDKQHHNITLDNMSHDDNDSFPPPPPPPAYQTATVHGIRRAKFLTKPLTHEINTLVHESDISCRHDLSQTSFTNASLGGGEQQQQQQPATSVCSPSSTTTATHCVMLSTEAIPTTITNINNFCTSSLTTNPAIIPSHSHTHTPSPSPSPASATATATLTNNTNSNNTIYERRESTSSPLTRVVNTTNTMTTQTGGGGATAAVAAAGVQLPTTSTTAVDIMEDEEEQEQQRLGNCPNGTPSRVPLLTHSSPQTNDKPRSFLNATAASFHRHTLNTFHRSNHSMANQRKSMIINRKGECNLHIPKRRNSSTTTICYGDHYETSDDELEGTNMYKLKHLQRPSHSHRQTDKHLNHIKSQDQEDYDNHSLVSLSDSLSQIPQVPIIVVLLILTFYVCLGTVIFALWENWSLIDGAYFCFVTLTTIGYGDFVPLKTFQGPEIQLFACCAYLLLGLVLVAMSFSILETQLIWKCKRLAVRLKLAKE